MTNSDPTDPISYRPDLPDWGVYLRWPAENDDWIHPEDVARARELIPSRRVFRRSRWDGDFYHLHYGSTLLRVRPSMWLRVPQVDLEVGQSVELLYRQGRNDPGIFLIADMLYVPETNRIEYYLRKQTLRLPRRYERRDLRPLRVRHQLRAGFYEHQPQRSRTPADVRLLNVGKLTED